MMIDIEFLRARQTNQSLKTMTDKHLNQIIAILQEALIKVECTAFLFGSRSDGTAVSTSDYDIGLMADRDIEGELAVARFRLEESNIPIEVDLVDLMKVDSGFRDVVMHSGIVLWTTSKDASAPAARLSIRS